MYTARYDYRKEVSFRKGSGGEISPLQGSEKTIVEAKFRFGGCASEAAEGFLDRIYPRYSNCSGSYGPFGDYLRDAEMLRLNSLNESTISYKISPEAGRLVRVYGTLIIPFSTLRDGFNLRLESPDRETALEDMIDLESLNDFILKGNPSNPPKNRSRHYIVQDVSGRRYPLIE